MFLDDKCLLQYQHQFCEKFHTNIFKPTCLHTVQKIIIAHVVDILYCIIESLITPINVCNRSHSLRNVYSSNPAVISEYLDMAILENAAVCLYRGLNVTGDTIYIDIQDIDSHKTITHSGIIYDMTKYSKLGEN